MEHYLLHTNRLWGQAKEITIVDPNHYTNFMRATADNLRWPPQFRLLVILLLSSGARISEVLQLKRKDINERGRFRIRVLKKRGKVVIRKCRLHPYGMNLLKRLDFTNEDLLFNLDRLSALRRMKKYIHHNFCNHSLRHSHISWQIFVLGKEPMRVATLMRVRLWVVEQYAHLSDDAELEAMFEYDLEEAA